MKFVNNYSATGVIPRYNLWEKRKKNYKKYTVPTHINLLRFIKIRGFQGGGLLKILPIKASKSGLLVQKSGGLFKFCCIGGLNKSGGLYVLIR